ncbi:MAG: hypothetical protein ACLFUH_01195 [Bacteroidales bacterium]
MDFSQWDMKIIVSMSIALVLMSLTFSNIGMAHDSFNASEIPEFNVSESRFDITGEMPEHPGHPSKGTLIWNTEDSVKDQNQVFLKGDYNVDDSYQLGLVNLGNQSDPELEAHIYEWNESGTSPENEDTYTFDNVSDYTELELGDFKVYVEWEEIEENDEYERWLVDWKVNEQPTSESFISRIPIVGNIASAGSELAGTVGWIGSIFAWFSLWITEIALNLIGILYEGISFFVGTFVWLVSSYTTLLENVETWAKIIVAIPGLLLSLEFVKVTWIIIKLIPTI